MLRYCTLLTAGVLFATGALAGCDSQPTEPRHDVVAFTILDGARGGNTQFYFLPPMVPAPTYCGVFDATQSPVVQICELAGNTCGATVASFSGSSVKVDPAEESYSATWKTKDAGLDPAKTYRIQVMVGTSVLGYADVVVLANGSLIRTVDRSQFVATINGGVLNIRFRIETAAPPPPPPPPCTPGTAGCGWRDGDVITHSPDIWGDPLTSAGELLLEHFDAVYFSVGGLLQVGGPITMSFTSAEAIQAYMPSAGNPGPLNSNLIDPLTSASGIFGGEVVSLKLNIDFSLAGHTLGTASLPFGILKLCGFGAPYAALNGASVNDVLTLVNTALGGGSTAIPIADLNLLAVLLNASFQGGVVSAFAQQHLFNGLCPPSGNWQDGDIISYSQTSWGEQSLPGGAQLIAYYDAVYASTFGIVEVGIPGSGGYSVIFTTVIAVLDYLPSTGPRATLNADLLDPLSSVSGVFGGEVLALRFNIDFSDAGYTLGTTGIRLGDLTLCGLSGSVVGLNGLSVRAFSASVNTALGGGSTSYSIADLDQTAFNINNAFNNGLANVFAQQFLFSGACP